MRTVSQSSRVPSTTSPRLAGSASAPEAGSSASAASTAARPAPAPHAALSVRRRMVRAHEGVAPPGPAAPAAPGAPPMGPRVLLPVRE